jgi:hypothetical protein
MQQACSVLGRAGIPLTAVLLLNSRWGASHSYQVGDRRLFSTISSGGSTSLPTTVCERAQDQFTASTSTQLSSAGYLDDDETQSNGRTGKTAADEYFREHGDIPRPSVMHAVLPLPQDAPEDNPRKDLLSWEIYTVVKRAHCTVSKAVHEVTAWISFCLLRWRSGKQGKTFGARRPSRLQHGSMVSC